MARAALSVRIGLLDDVGLVPALDWVREFGKQSAIACEWHHDQAAQDFSFIPEAGTALFRICQEALTNVSRHAGATKATVRLAVADAIVLCIEDNGKGITAEQIASPRAFGLLGMKERLLPLGGRLDISSGKERGTIIRATMPTESARRRDND